LVLWGQRTVAGAVASQLQGFVRRAFAQTWFRYLFGLASLALAYGLRIALLPWTGWGAPFALFMAAMLVTCVLAGVGPGVMVLVSGLMMAAVLFVVPSGATPSQAALQSFLYGVDGAIVIYLTYVTRAARDRLELADQRSRQMVNLSPDAYFQTNADGRFIDVNSAACQLLGYSHDEMLGKRPRDIIPPDDVPRVLGARQTLESRREMERGEWTMVRKDGTALSVEVSANILPGGRWQAFVRNISDRQQATERLRQSEERFRAIFEEAPIGMALISTDGRFLHVNRALCDITGYSAEELEKLTYQEITSPEDLQRTLRMTEQAQRGEEPKYQIEKRYVRKDGRTVTIDVHGSFVPGPDGRPLYYVGQFEDITERKRGDEVLRESEAKFRSVIESMPDGVFIYQGDRIVFANGGFATLLGYASASDIIGLNMRDYLTPESMRIVEARIRRFGIGAEAAPAQEMLMVRADRSLVTVETVGIAATYEGAPAIVVVVRDLGDRKRAEREQRLLAEVGVAMSETLDYDATLASVARLAVRDFADWCLVEVLEEPGAVRRLKVVTADPAKEHRAREYEQIPLSRERSPLLKPVVEARRPLLIPRVGAEHLAALMPTPEQLAAIRAIGPLSAMVVPLLIRERVLGTLTFASTSPARIYGPADLRLAQAVAERAALAIDNARLYRAALQAKALRDQVLGVVAHDLRSPLTTIALHANRLKRTGPEPERRNSRHRDAILHAAERMNHLIQDLLDVVVLEAGKLSVDRSRLSSRALLTEVIDAQKALVGSASLELRAELADDLPDVLGDHHRLLQVFENLVGNAVKFTEGGGLVAIGGARSESGVIFWVSDTGRGLASAEMEHVFDRFWQATARPGRLGAGLGLPICKGIVEAHGGRIWVDSAPGRGTTFYFSIPPAPPSEEHAGETAH
jgi:PAS domain S-box-containing protein